MIWKTIESAPKNTEVLVSGVAGGVGQVSLGRLHKDHPYLKPETWSWHLDGNNVYFTPTHWQLKPEGATLSKVQDGK